MPSPEIPSPPAPEPAPAKRGRPKTRYAERDEQIRQNMRLYRARRDGELRALARALEGLRAPLDGADKDRLAGAAAALLGLWDNSSLKDNVIKNIQKHSKARNEDGSA